MLLNVVENLEIGAPVADVWRLLRDTERFAGLVPGVEHVEPMELPDKEAYRVRVTEKVGPFKVTMKLEVTITEMQELAVIGASVKGGDAMGISRATGPLRVELSAAPGGTAMALTVNIEILGKLAALGAPVVRRRVNELFAVFAKRVVAEFAAVQPS
jgi:carbon monoxide dehydrogenase subunit G